LVWHITQLVTVIGFLMACSGFLIQAVEAPSPTPTVPRTFWVAVDGKADNDGSEENPLDLATALSDQGPVRAGDTVWLRGGTYRGAFTSSLTGTPDAPIVVRQVPGERATVDSGASPHDALSAGGAHTWFWGFEITSSHAKRKSAESGSWPGDLQRGYGAVTRARGIRFINLLVHDNANGLGLWSEAVGSDAYGNIVYNNGWQASDRAHGHGIYTQNESGTRRLVDNIIFNQFSHGIHAFGSAVAHLNNITLEGNIVFNNGALAAEPEYVRNLLLGGGRPAVNPRLEDNMTYFGSRKASGENNIGYGTGCVNLWARGNYLMGGRPLILGNCSPQLFADNTLYGATPEDPPIDFPGNQYYTAPPTGTRVFVRPNRCEPGRAHVAIYNWDLQPHVRVDLSEAALVENERFVIRDVQNYFGTPVAEGTYKANAVHIPMNGLHAQPPVGDVPGVAHTGPQFGAFVVLQPGVVAAARGLVPDGCEPSGTSTEAGKSAFGEFLKSWGF
jgi:hypothetical protein